MAVFKRFDGKRITSKHPKYATARWWCYKRIKGHKTIHQAIPEARTKQQAELAERRLIDSLFGIKYGVPDAETTFAQFVDTVYLAYVEQKNKNAYVKRLFIKTLKSYFGPRVLSSITANDCREYQHRRLHTPTKAGPRANASVNRETSTLSKIFTLAIQEKIIGDNPMRFVEPLEESPPRRRDLSPEQRIALTIALQADPDLHDVVVLGMTLPIRRGQIFMITAESIDFAAAILWVVKSKGKPARPVPVNNIALSVLRRRAAGVSGRIFDYTPTKFQKHWSKVLIAAKINIKGGTREDNFHFHDLRHALGSELVNKNTNPYYIQELFDHSDMKTSAIYITPEMKKLADAVANLKGLPVIESDTVN